MLTFFQFSIKHQPYKSISHILQKQLFTLIIGTQFQQKDKTAQLHIVKLLKFHSFAHILVLSSIIQSQSLQSQNGKEFTILIYFTFLLLKILSLSAIMNSSFADTSSFSVKS